MNTKNTHRYKISSSDIPVVILCGGRGTRIGPLTRNIPKPLIEVGQKPILWHVMKIYAAQGFCNFILCLGYKGNEIKKYFHKYNPEHWKIQFVDTGIDCTKSQRIIQIKQLIKTNTFFLAYGDDVADIDLSKLLHVHAKNKLTTTITTVKLVSDFGIINIGKKNIITSFHEKPVLNKWINAGFMVLDTKIFHYLKIGELENEVFERLAKEKKIGACKHIGRWKAMNTLKDNIELNTLWKNKQAFWKIWR